MGELDPTDFGRESLRRCPGVQETSCTWFVQKLLEELESLEVPAEIREARLAALKRDAAEFAAMHEKQHGQYT